MILHLFGLLIGSIAASSSVLMIKASTIPPGYLGAMRLILAALLFLGPAIHRHMKVPRGTEPSLKEVVLPSILPGIFLGVHFITWNTGARLTLAANASLIVNMIPLVMPVMVFLLYKISITRREIFGSALALGGIFLLSKGSVQLNPEFITGDLITLVSMVFFASYLVLAKKASHLPLLSYLVVVYSIGGITSFIGGMILDGPFLGEYLLPPEVFFAVGLALIPTMMGHTLINNGMRNLPSQVVSIGQLTQFIWATILAFLLFGEVPPFLFFPAAGLVLLGGALSISSHWTGWQKTPGSDSPVAPGDDPVV